MYVKKTRNPMKWRHDSPDIKTGKISGYRAGGGIKWEDTHINIRVMIDVQNCERKNQIILYT